MNSLCENTKSILFIRLLLLRFLIFLNIESLGIFNKCTMFSGSKFLLHCFNLLIALVKYALQ